MADKPWHFRRVKARTFLTDDQVREIRKQYKAGGNSKDIGRKFKISRQYVTAIAKGRQRKEVV